MISTALLGGLLCAASQTQHNCPPNADTFFVYETRPHGVGGFGSRMWGMAYAYLVSKMTRRVLVINHPHPRQLSEVFDIRTEYLPKCNGNWGRALDLRLVDKTLPSDLLRKKDIAAAWKPYDTVTAQGINMPCEDQLQHNPHYNLTTLGVLETADAQQYPWRIKETKRRMLQRYRPWISNAWHRLFVKPSAAVYDVVRTQLDQIESTETTIAIHARLGGMFADGSHDPIRTPFEELQWFVDCAKNISTSAAWIVIADNDKAKKWITKRAPTAVITTDWDAVHTDRSKSVSKRQWLETAADWLLITRATHIIQSPSSFSFTAALWARKTPILWGERCPLSLLQHQNRFTRAGGRQK